MFKKIKRILKIIAYVLLIMLACTGIGLTGAAPFQSQHRQQLPEENHVEMVEKEEEEKDQEEEKIG
ncbi:MAG: hypothetical protein R8P61_12030 [Bacteroidia bacterium]|nr:hypothetical protein [Bacteroidia bacterium]